MASANAGDAPKSGQTPAKDTAGRKSASRATKAKNTAQSKALLALIQETLESEKAEEIVTIDLNGKSQIADAMVVASGRSSRQVTSLAEKIAEKVKADLGVLCRIEGKDQGDWVLLDCGDAIVHIFRPEVREFYQLEKMWLPADSAQG